MYNWKGRLKLQDNEIKNVQRAIWNECEGHNR
jgi:hypothetical protein